MPLLLIATLLSGVAALVYQVVWIRELSLVLGSSTESMATVVGAFMAGLAIGSAWLGRVADRVARPLRLYLWLEVGIAASALLAVGAIRALEAVWPWLATGSAGVATVGRVVGCLIVLTIPTALMGGTYPVLVRATAGRVAGIGSVAAWLYGANTLGAMIGCFGAGLWLIGSLGLDGGYAVAVALNLASGGVAWLASRRRLWPEPAASAALVDGAAATSRPRWILLAVAVSGALALAYEIMLGRLFAIMLGHSSYATTFVLGTYLGGLTLGSLAVSRLVDRLRRPFATFAALAAALAITSGAALLVLPAIPFQDYEQGMAPWPYVAANLLSTALLILPPTVLLGALLPVAVRIAATGPARTGRDAGRVYAWNTVGAIVGSLLAGFVLVPELGTQRGVLVVVAGNAVLALAIGAAVGGGRATRIVAAATLVAAAVTWFADDATSVVRARVLARLERALGTEVRLQEFTEDRVAAVGLGTESDGTQRLSTDGVPMTHWGLETIWMAHLPIAAAAEPRRALVLCLGMGNTYRSMVARGLQTTAVELSPAVVALFSRLHGDMPPPREGSAIVVGDGRHAVTVGSEAYDVITVDPPPPLYAAGTVHFHTREFYAACRARLTPGGVVCMWLPFFHCTVADYRMLVQTFRAVFPAAEAYSFLGGSNRVIGLCLLGSLHDAPLDPTRLARGCDDPAVLADLRRFHPEATPAEFAVRLPRRVLDVAGMAAFAGDAPVLGDRFPWLEYPLFRCAGDTVPMGVDALVAFATATRSGR